MSTVSNGATFTALYTHSSPSAEIRYLEVSRSNPDVIYFTVKTSSPDDGELWKTIDGGVNWTQCTNPGTLTASQRRFSKITLSGTDANTLWWCFRTGPNGQKVFKSIDGGTTWTNWTTTTLNNVNATDILHQLGTDGGVYFISGSGNKVYYRDNTDTDWTAYDTGLPLNLYGDFGGVFAKPYYKGGKLRLGSGNGIWEADLYTTSTTTLVQPMVDNAAPTCSRDTLQLESYSVTNGTASYQWSLSPAPQWISDPNIRNPRVVLGTTTGPFSATLTVTDDDTATAVDVVVAATATDHVVAEAAEDLVAAFAPVNRGGAAAVVHDVVDAVTAEQAGGGAVVASGHVVVAGITVQRRASAAVVDEDVVAVAAMELDLGGHTLLDVDVVVPFATEGDNLLDALEDRLAATEHDADDLAIGVRPDPFDGVQLVRGALGQAALGVAVAHVQVQHAVRGRRVPDADIPHPVAGQVDIARQLDVTDGETHRHPDPHEQDLDRGRSPHRGRSHHARNGLGRQGRRIEDRANRR